MNDERPEERQIERDSQLSAMFDGELPAAECELLARRLTRDEALRAQWSRFAIIGATLRAERGVALHDRVAWRIQSAIAQEPIYGEGTLDSTLPSTRVTDAVHTTAARSSRDRWARIARPLAGASIAASVAAASLLFLRTQESPDEFLAVTPSTTESIVLTPEPTATMVALNDPAPAARAVSNGEPERYSTPVPSSQTVIVPPARLANYVVAHSEYSGPLTRRMALLGIVGTENAADTGEAPAQDDGTEGTDAP